MQCIRVYYEKNVLIPIDCSRLSRCYAASSYMRSLFGGGGRCCRNVKTERSGIVGSMKTQRHKNDKGLQDNIRGSRTGAGGTSPADRLALERRVVNLSWGRASPKGESNNYREETIVDHVERRDVNRRLDKGAYA